MDPGEAAQLTVEQKLHYFWHPRRRPPPVSAPFYEPTPPTCERAIRRFEEEHSVRLPTAFRALLLEQNGGACRFTHHPGINGEFRGVGGIGTRDPLRTDWSETLEFMEDQQIRHPEGLAAMVGLAGDGHYYTCLDYGRGSPDAPVVTFVDIELWEPAEVLSQTFEGFVASLQYSVSSPQWAVPWESLGEDPVAHLSALFAAPVVQSSLGKWSSPDDVPMQRVILEEPTPDRKLGNFLAAWPNRQRDGVLLVPWRPSADWIVESRVATEREDEFSKRIEEVGEGWVLQGRPR